MPGLQKPQRCHRTNCKQGHQSNKNLEIYTKLLKLLLHQAIFTGDFRNLDEHSKTIESAGIKEEDFKKTLLESKETIDLILKDPRILEKSH